MRTKQQRAYRQPRSVARAAGFSLIEIMVALVIGLLTTIVIMQMLATSEGYKRTTTSGADAQTNSAVALYLMEREIRQAGHSMAPNLEDYASSPALSSPPNGPLTTGILAQCTKVIAYRGSYTITYDNSQFAPVLINPKNAANTLMFPAGDANTDVILVNYGTASTVVGKGIDIVTNANTTQSGGDALDFSVTASRAGINQGELILAVPPAGSGSDCTIREVTGLPIVASGNQCPTAITGQINQINHNNLTYENFYTGCGSQVATWNRPNGPAVTYNAGSKIYSLGPVGRFVSRVFAIRGGNLTTCDLTIRNCTDTTKTTDATYWTPVASGVVGLMAQYGIDDGSNGGTADDGVVDAWNTTQPVGAARAQIISFRLALVARNGQYDKEVLTTAAPVWRADMSGTADADIDVSLSSGTVDPNLWKHYRYVVAQSVVPLRNLIWGQQQ